MARYTGAVCKLCRREASKLYLKGKRCYSDKCAMERKAYPPGHHGRARGRKVSPYGIQLREKQKAKRIYGVLEKQFRNYFAKADRQKGVTGENLLQFLERRLDNIVFRCGFAPSRKSARQFVLHRHFTVDNQVVNIPSFSVRPGEVVQVREKSRNIGIINMAIQQHGRKDQLSWLNVDKDTYSGTLLETPKREDIPTPLEEHLIIELYSK
ncbi:MAG: 30S ribosomal protein S4 [Candidatus Cloacimonetes bacterium 4572_55]|nr:MAG: 30S ribosomal protein S4 [Candidatus Cloacimonetes bacterium 4572_55]